MPKKKLTISEQVAELFKGNPIPGAHEARAVGRLLANIIDTQAAEIGALKERLEVVEGTAKRVDHRTKGMEVIGPGPGYRPHGGILRE